MIQEKIKHIFQKERGKLLNYLSSRVPAEIDPEDMLQDIFTQALGQLNALEAVDNLAAWFFTVAKNKIIDAYRRKKVPEISIQDSMDDEMSLDQLLVENTNDSWDAQTREYVDAEIIRCVEKLPEKQQYVFIQNVVEERSFREIAEETGESINTLLARKRYAVQTLRQELHELKISLED